MTRQRKYLDTKRRVLLQGRPIYPDWGLLLHLGKRAVDRGWADEAPFLSDVMWRGINEGGVWPQPAAFCNELLREWLTVDEPAACSFLREQWGHVRAPETSAEAVERLSADDCHERGIDHRLRSAWSTN